MQLGVAKTNNNLVIEKNSSELFEQESRKIPLKYLPLFFHPIPVNKAQKEMLMTVKGVGPTMADNIIQYRQQHGPFDNIADLQKVKGIGKSRARHYSSNFHF